MPTSPSTSILAASRDAQLLDRASVIAVMQGVPDPHLVLMGNALRFALAPVDDAGNTVATVYDYASTVRAQALTAARAVVADRQAALDAAEADLRDVEQLPPVGSDLAAVTDSHLTHAITALITAGVLTGSPTV
jgi:hypothetical protein